MKQIDTGYLKLKSNLTILLASLIVSLGVGSFSSAEAQRYVDVEPDNFPAFIGSLNAAIENDSEREENTIYRLERGGTYWLDAIIEPQGGVLHIEAEEGDGPLPVIKPAANLEGQAVELFNPRSDIIFKNLYLQGLSDLGEITKNNVRARGDNLRIEVDNIYFDWDDQAYFRLDNQGNTLIITNSQFRNTGRPGNTGVGRWIDTRSNRQDTIRVENSTFYHGETAIVRTAGGVIENAIFNHNTVVNTGTDWDFGNILNLEFTNNLLIDNGYRGIGTPTDSLGNIMPADSITAGIISISSINDLEDTDDEGNVIREYNDSERSLVIRNNNLGFISQKYLDLYDEFSDSVAVRRPILNFDADSLMDVGILVYENNFEEGVEFTDAPEGSVDWTRAILEEPGDTDPPPSFDRYNDSMDDPVNAANLDHWRDFTYPTTSTSYSAAENGFPVGDLNWFPDKKAEWESGEFTSTEIIDVVPNQFKLNGNYPNPFNPSTTISFDLASHANVSMEVYNILGAKVSTLDLGSRQAGTHDVRFDASDLPSGIYIVRMTAGEQMATMRMTLIK